jgi:cytochrome c oxidase subunit II
MCRILRHLVRPPVRPPSTRRELFFLNGCAACHSIRGTEARGKIGPDLTHVGSRLTLGAGIVPNDQHGFVRWLEQTDRVKPGVHMPHFRMLPAAELNALAAYLESLK